MKYNNIPDPAGLFRALMHTTHDSKSAIADIIDNSLDAKASLVNIKTTKADNKPRIIIADNGLGMTEQVLADALRLGHHGRAARANLGTFGMGMKTSFLSLSGRENGHPVSVLEVISKTQSTDFVKATMDPVSMAKSGKWEVEVHSPSNEDIELFNELTENSKSGTVLIINDPYITGLSSFATSLRSYIGQTFRYFISSPSSTYFTGTTEFRVNDTKISAVDPLERDLPNTKTWLGKNNSGNIIVDPDNDKFLKVTLVELSKDDNHLIPPLGKNAKNHGRNQYNQGFYLVRNRRQIMAGETALFRDIWGADHNTLNYCRVEIQYKNMDEEFKVNHDKCAIVELDQSIKQKIRTKVGQLISDCKTRKSAEKTSSEVDEVSGIHNASATKFTMNPGSMDLPSGTIRDKVDDPDEDDTPGEDDEPTICPPEPIRDPSPPGGSKGPYTGKRPGGVPKYKVEYASYGSSGAVLEYDFENGVFVIKWNTDHSYYQKYVSVIDEDQSDAIHFMIFALLSYWRSSIDNGMFDYAMQSNFLSTLSNNLRSAASD